MTAVGDAQTQLHHHEGEGTNYSWLVYYVLWSERGYGDKANKEATPCDVCA